MIKKSYDGLYSHARLPVRLLHDPFFAELPESGKWLFVAVYLWLVENRKRSLAPSEQSPAILANIAGLDKRRVPSLLQKCTELGLLQKTDDGHLSITGIEEMAHANTKWRDGEGEEIPDNSPANPRQIPRTGGGNSRRNRRIEEAEEEGAPPATPTLSQVLSLASEMSHPADDATRYFQNREGKGWHNITDWQADFRAWAARYRPPAAPAPASVNRFDPDFVAPEVVAAQQNRRNVKTAIIAAAIAAGRRLSPTEYRNLLCDDGALAAIPADDRQSGIEAAINSTEWRALPPPTATPGKAGPMAATLTRLAQKAGVG